MESLDYEPKAHFFICARHRDDKACCASRGSKELLQDLKKWVKDEKLFCDLKVSGSSCLGYCQTGIAACLYPEKKWFHKIDPERIHEIKERLKSYTDSQKSK